MNDFTLKILNASIGKTHLFYVGQAGYILKSSSGQLLGIDLYLSECVERIEGHIGFKRLLPKILFPFELEFDAIITTHSHFDHFDFDSIPELMANKRTKLYASVNCEEEVKRLYMENDQITYVQAGDLYNIGDYSLKFVSCDHGAAAPDAVGVIITVDGKRIYITGDTCLRTDRVEEYTKQGIIDIMIAPINGTFGNMSEQDCAELSNVLSPKVTIPCHYGMFATHGGNVGLFIKKMKQICPQNEFFIMELGGTITI